MNSGIMWMGNTYSLLVKMQAGAATIEIHVLIQQKLEIGLPPDPATLCWNIYI